MWLQIFSSGISFLHSYQSFVITLHAQLEFLHLAGKQTPRSHEHINSSQSVTGDMVHAHTVLTEADWKC